MEKMVFRPNTYRFLKHVDRFIQEHKLFENEEPIVLSVSGGVDSMVLLYVLKSLVASPTFNYTNPLEVLFFHHGTRAGQDHDWELVKATCNKWRVKVRRVDLKMGRTISNFEMRARELRYQQYHLKYPQKKILQAHHLDDAMEWSLMQKLKSSSLEGQLGIPVSINQIRRPFLCVTKKQLLRIAQQEEVPFNNDPTNTDTDFERNYIRLMLTSLRGRYPQYLKHYVSQQRMLLDLFKLQQEQSIFQWKERELNLAVHREKVAKYPSLFISDLRSRVQLLSCKNRGNTQQQLEKAYQMIANKRYGRIQFSGNVVAVISTKKLVLKKQ